MEMKKTKKLQRNVNGKQKKKKEILKPIFVTWNELPIGIDCGQKRIMHEK